LNVLDKEYIEDYVDVAKLAPELGYEVDLRKEKGVLVGERKQAYFDLRGKELRGDNDTRKKECFNLVYPVTFVMPDGTKCTIKSEDDLKGWEEIKIWYKLHPDGNKRPALLYPVNIIFKDGTKVMVLNEEQMNNIYEKCDGE